MYESQVFLAGTSLQISVIGIPSEATFETQLGLGGNRWTPPQVLEDLKTKAKELGLWNMFLSDHYQEGPGFSNLEYGLMAELLGRSKIASEVLRPQISICTQSEAN